MEIIPGGAGAAILPPRVVVYGPPGVGKTTWACGSASRTLLLASEQGADGVGVDRVVLRDWRSTVDTLGELVRDTMEYEVLVLDSITATERQIHAQVARDAGEATVAEIGYGRGYVASAAEVGRALRALDLIRARGVTIVVVAHETVAQVSDPTVGEYQRTDIALDRRARAAVVEWADVVAYASMADIVLVDGRARVRGAERQLVTAPSPACVAKRRVGYDLPDTLPLVRADFDAAICGYQKGDLT